MHSLGKKDIGEQRSNFRAVMPFSLSVHAKEAIFVQLKMSIVSLCVCGKARMTHLYAHDYRRECLPRTHVCVHVETWRREVEIVQMRAITPRNLIPRGLHLWLWVRGREGRRRFCLFPLCIFLPTFSLSRVGCSFAGESQGKYFWHVTWRCESLFDTRSLRRQWCTSQNWDGPFPRQRGLQKITTYIHNQSLLWFVFMHDRTLV